jgi:hypothetical protein
MEIVNRHKFQALGVKILMIFLNINVIRQVNMWDFDGKLL